MDTRRQMMVCFLLGDEKRAADREVVRRPGLEETSGQTSVKT